MASLILPFQEITSVSLMISFLVGSEVEVRVIDEKF
jgi:hypothetical protein